jgi:Ribonuclease G/E
MEEDKKIVLSEDQTLILEIYDAKGNKTGEHLEFDIGDIELPLRYQELIESDKKNRETLRNTMLVLEKKPDAPGKGGMTRNQEEQVRALVDFFKKEVEIYNLFLGENGVQKLLNGRKLRWETLTEIDEIIEKQIRPYIEIDTKRLIDNVKEAYGKVQKQIQEETKEEEIEILD